MPRGQRRALPRDFSQEEQPDPGDQDTRREREQSRDRDSPAEWWAARERPSASERLMPTAAFLDGIRAYLYEDVTVPDAARRVPEEALRARRHYLVHETPIARSDTQRDMSSNQPSRDLQRRFSREPPPRRSDLQLPGFSNPSNPAASLPPLRTLSNRRGSNTASSPGGSSGHPSRQRPERMMRGYRGPEQRQPDTTSLEDMENDVSSHLQALLHYTNATVASPLSPSSHSHTPQHDQAEDSRRVKRRKLDSERPGSTFKGFRYGRFGQIEPGQLKMEIDSCDGGVYADDANNPPENILINNDSVYCSKKDSCNIVLRHQGATVFTLTELIIRAPGPRYSAPIREGLVFVSMATDELFMRTAQYKVKYVTSQEPRSSAAEPEAASILSVRHNEDGTTTTRLHRHMFHPRLEDPADHKTAVFPADPLPFPVTIATDCSDPENTTQPPRIRRQHPPDRIGALPFESESSEDGENVLGGWDDIRFDDEEDTPPPTYHRRAQDMTLAEAAEASQLATQEAVQAVGGKLLRPHAKFFIEKGKNRCTIKFDPPVTGRFVLLKMYHPSDNIDIQGVYAKGFAGPRYFPSIELR